MTVHKLINKLKPWQQLLADAERVADTLQGLGDFVGARLERQRAESLREAMRHIGVMASRRGLI